MNKILRLLVAVSAIGVFVAAPLSPANAGEGTFRFEGEADLPTFPCGSPTNPCSGGTFSGTLSGTFHTGTGNVGVGIDIAMSASFEYSEPAATCPAEGTAEGSFSFDSNISGTVQGPGTTRVRGSGNFTWTRVGATAVITIDSGTVIVTNATGDHSQAIEGSAEAAFEAPPTVAVTHCPNPQALNDVHVEGAGEVHPAV
jgi:hypothetical protein